MDICKDRNPDMLSECVKDASNLKHECICIDDDEDSSTAISNFSDLDLDVMELEKYSSEFNDNGENIIEKAKQQVNKVTFERKAIDFRKELEPPEHLFGIYYCKICNIHVKSQVTYNTHINGKKHRKALKLRSYSEIAMARDSSKCENPFAYLKNVKNSPTYKSGFTKYPLPPPGVVRKKVNKRAKIQRIIETEVGTPCPGLDLVTEIQGIDEVKYYCIICDSICFSNSIIPHLTGFKHRLRSVKLFKPGDYSTMTYEPKYKIEKEVISILRAVQKKRGLGLMSVEIEEPSPGNMPKNDSQPSTSKDMPFAPSYSTAFYKSSSDLICSSFKRHSDSLQMSNSELQIPKNLP